MKYFVLITLFAFFIIAATDYKNEKIPVEVFEMIEMNSATDDIEKEKEHFKTLF